MQRYQKDLEEKIKGSEFAFDSVGLLDYKCNKISKSYTDSREWLKNKKATINTENNDDKCFQYAITVALNDEKI